MSRRVVITAAGIASPVGYGLDLVFEGIRRGTPGTGMIRNFDCRAFPCRLGAEVKDEGCGSGGAEGERPRDRKEIFLGRALEQLSRGGAFEGTDPARRHFIVGMGLDYFDLPAFAEKGGPWQDYSANSLDMARRLAVEYDFSGEVTVNVNACVAGSQALGLAYRLLRESGAPRMAISGGVDSMLNPLHYMGFYKLGALSAWEGDPEEACRPFDRRRQGLVLGEGAALYALRRADDVDPGRVLAEIRGYASTMDAYMVTDPDPSGRNLAAAAQQAIRNAGLHEDDIDCVHLHGTGTHKNDLAETGAMKIIFGKRYRDIPVYSMKGQVGHCIAACGAMELAGVLFSLATQSVPPTVNFAEPDPQAPLRVVSGQPLPMEIRHVLKLNAAFGGQNTALVVSKYDA